MTRRGVNPLAALVAGATVSFVLLGILSVAAMTSAGWGMGGAMRGMMGGGANTSDAPLTAGGVSESVTIQNFAFAPGNLEVPAGAQITFTNRDAAPHSATAKDGSWDTGVLSKGESKTLVFATAGDYTYYCRVHPSMVARLRVL